jgi:hypothetical protein
MICANGPHTLYSLFHNIYYGGCGVDKKGCGKGLLSGMGVTKRGCGVAKRGRGVVTWKWEVFANRGCSVARLPA